MLTDREIVARFKAAVAAGLITEEKLLAVMDIIAAATTQGITPEDITALIDTTYPHHTQGILDTLNKMDAERAAGGWVRSGVPYLVGDTSGEEFVVRYADPDNTTSPWVPSSLLMRPGIANTPIISIGDDDAE